MKVQLLMTDDYGSTTIHNTGPDFGSMIKAGKDMVTAENVNNPLTVDEKKRNWENCLPMLFDEDGELADNAYYAGKDNRGNHVANFVGEDGEVKTVSMSQLDANVKIYLGDLDKEDWFAEDNRGRLIESLDHPDLADKSVYFVRNIG